MNFYSIPKYLCCLILIIGLISCGPVHKQILPTVDNIDRIKKLAIFIPNEPDFTVIYDRTKATAAPAVFFGLVGAAVASAHNQSSDNQKAIVIAPHLENFSFRSTFIESLDKTLNNSGRFTEIQVFDKELKSTEAQNYDAIATFRIRNWGLRLANRENNQMSAFIELEIKMIQTRENKILWDEHEVVLGKSQNTFDSYKKDKDMTLNDIKETVEDTGFRMANKLIYQ